MLLAVWLVTETWIGTATAGCPGEAERAEALFQRIEREWPLRGSGDPVTRYVRQLGLRLAAAAPLARPGTLRFFVVRNLAANAFAIGGGFIFVTDGVFAFVKSESEIAAIIAHELGHETAGHLCAAQAADTGGSVFDRFFASDDAPVRFPVGSMMQIVDPAKEQQADRIALSILQAAGFDPRAMLHVAQRLPQRDGIQSSDAERVSRLRALVDMYPSVSPRDSEIFTELRRQIAVQGSPSVHE